MSFTLSDLYPGYVLEMEDGEWEVAQIHMTADGCSAQIRLDKVGVEPGNVDLDLSPGVHVVSAEDLDAAGALEGLQSDPDVSAQKELPPASDPNTGPLIETETPKEWQEN